jgi:hypothetical protein
MNRRGLDEFLHGAPDHRRRLGVNRLAAMGWIGRSVLAGQSGVDHLHKTDRLGGITDMSTVEHLSVCGAPGGAARFIRADVPVPHPDDKFASRRARIDRSSPRPLHLPNLMSQACRLPPIYG